MADSKLTALSEITAPALTDIMYLVATPGGTPAEKKLELTNLLKLINVDGWIPAGETWVYASADDPTFTFTIAGVDLTTKYYPGMRLKLTQTTPKYFIVTKVAFSTNTTVTVYGGTDYDLADAAITLPYYSTAKAPAGFPLDPLKWMVEVKDTTDATQATPSANTWYNLGTVTISIPIGVWNVGYWATLYIADTNVIRASAQITLSTANDSESDNDFTGRLSINTDDVSGIVIAISAIQTKTKYLALTAKTAYYLNALSETATADSIYFLGSSTYGTTIVRAVCAYL